MATAQDVGDRVRITIGEDRFVVRVGGIGQDSIYTTTGLFRTTRSSVAWENSVLGSIPGALIGRLVSRWETVETDRGGDMVFLPTVDLRLGPQARLRLSIGGHLRF